MILIWVIKVLEAMVAGSQGRFYPKVDFGRHRSWHIRFYMQMSEINMVADAKVFLPTQRFEKFIEKGIGQFITI